MPTKKMDTKISGTTHYSIWDTFSQWIDSWATKLDWIGLVVWLALLYLFGSFTYFSYNQEYAPTAGGYGLALTLVIFIAGMGVRYAIYRFVQKPRHMRVGV